MTQPQIWLWLGIAAWCAVWWWLGTIVLTVTFVGFFAALFGWLFICFVARAASDDEH